MGLFSKKKYGDRKGPICCDLHDYLFWKWDHDNQNPPISNQGGEIHQNSIIQVKNGEVAVLSISFNGGIYQEVLEGPYIGTIKDLLIPTTDGGMALVTGSSSIAVLEIYFVNVSATIQYRARVPYFDVFDPREGLMDFPVKCAVQYQILCQINDYRAFVNIHRLTGLTAKELEDKIKPVINKHIRALVVNLPKEKNIAAVQIETQLDAINLLSEYRVKPEVEKLFGIQLSNLSIDKIDIDKDDEQYHKLKKLTADITERRTITQAAIEIDTIQARSDIGIQNLKDVQRINTQHSEEMMRIQREEAQRAQRLQTESNFYETHKLNIETSGSMGGVGLPLGQNTAVPPTTHHSPPGPPPPPPPSAQFFLSVNGQQTGPFSIQELQHYLNIGQFNRTTYVWKQGMQNWEEAGRVSELQALFSNVPPPPPPYSNNTTD